MIYLRYFKYLNQFVFVLFLNKFFFVLNIKTSDNFKNRLDLDTSNFELSIDDQLIESSFKTPLNGTQNLTHGSTVQRKNLSSVISSLKNNNFKVTALVGKSITLTCAIDLDDINFSKSGNYKIIWSREIENGKDYEPLALDDARLVSNPRITPSRLVIHRSGYDQIQWNLVIDDLKLSDSNNYICQLNRKPYDVYWLKRYVLNVNEPAYFDDENLSTEITPGKKHENSIFVKSINEFEDFKLKCNAKGKPKPNVSWYLRYMNGTSLQLDVDNTEIVIKNIKKTSKIDRVECQVSNGYGPTVIRSFKINIKHAPQIISKSRVFRVPVRTNELKLNCSVVSNPISSISWQFLPIESLQYDFERSYNNNNYDYTETSPKQEWKSINIIASYSFKYNHDNDNSLVNNNNSFIKLPLSKYQIYEKHANSNQIISILVIKMINEKDFGMYRCFASNDVGNKTIDFKIQELNHQMNGDKMRSIEREKVNSFPKYKTKKPKFNKNSKYDEETYSYEEKYDDNNEPEFYSDSNKSNKNFSNMNSFFLFLFICYFFV